MRFIVERNAFLSAAKVAAQVAPARTTMPITQCVVIKAEGDRVVLVSTDGNSLRVDQSVAARVIEEGVTALNAATVAGVVGQLPDVGVTFARGEGARNVVVSADAHAVDMRSMDADEFPESIDGEFQPFASMGSDTLLAAIQHVVYASGDGSQLPLLGGGQMTIDEGDLRVTATDGFRLARYRGEAVTVEGQDGGEIVVPAVTLEKVAGLLKNDIGKAVILLHETGTVARFTFAEITVTAALLVGEYPDVGRRIPEKGTTRLVAPVAEVARAVAIAEIIARDEARGVVFDITPAEGAPGAGVMSVSSTSEEHGSSRSLVNVRMEGPATRIGLSPAFVREMLRRLASGSDTIEMLLNEANDPIRIIDGPVDHVIMPVSLHPIDHPKAEDDEVGVDDEGPVEAPPVEVPPVEAAA